MRHLKQNSDAQNSRTTMYARVFALRDFTLFAGLKSFLQGSAQHLKQNFMIIQLDKCYGY